MDVDEANDQIVALCLSAYLDAKPSTQSITVLTKILRNASTKREAKYRMVRLSNPHVRENLVLTFGALDVLSLVGFHQTEVDGEAFLFYDDDSYPCAKSLISKVLNQLGPLVPVSQQQQDKPTAKASGGGTKPVAPDTVFLSEAERKERARKMVAVKRERQKEREAVQRRIEEDKQERLSKFQRGNQQMKYSEDNSSLPAGVVVRKLHDTFAKPAATSQKIAPASLKQDEASTMKNPPSPAELSSPSQDEQKPSALFNEDLSKDGVDELFKGFPGCSSAIGIRDSSVYRDVADDLPQKCLKRLYRELGEMELPINPSIWLKYDEETPQFLRFVVAAPPDTPYAHGLFAFDMKIPNDYPFSSPSVTLLTTGSGRVRFGPNLYDNGRVCLSLLGTWEGPKWNPKASSIQQVLVSIQGLILGVDHPYYLEPGYGAWEGKVKDGQFKVHGHTLRGETVTEDVGIPPEVIEYEDKIRLGTLKYAIAEMTNVPSYLKTFRGEIQMHFYCNRDNICQESEGWKYLPCFGYKRPGNVTNEMESLVDKIRDKLATLTKPEVPVAMMVAAAASLDVLNERADAMDTPELVANDDDVNLVSEQLVEAMVHDTEEDSKIPATDQRLSLMNTEMLAAAARGDFVQAGELQNKIKLINLVHQKMVDSAAEGDFIEAGRLQQQYFALLSTSGYAADHSNESGESMDEDTGEGFDGDNMEDDVEDIGDDGIDDDEDQEEDQEHSDNDDDPPGDNSSHPLGFQSAYGGFKVGKNVFIPENRRQDCSNPRHSWGRGASVASSSTLVTGMPNTEQMDAAVAHTISSPQSICRIRFRLPDGRTSVNDFRKDEKLSAVYDILKSVMECGDVEGQNNSSIAPLVAGGAFAQPMSSTGYTLLLSHPKREFNFEMHGSKSLVELELSPSATLTVMKCSQRGVVHRGELEARLAEAQDGAMNLDGLTYEGLLELTERVGGAAPRLSKETLELNSSLFSPATYFSSGNKIDQRCPVCLGDYDPEEDMHVLRQLTRCGHIFHTACLETWLKTRSSCPICKTSVAEA